MAFDRESYRAAPLTVVTNTVTETKQYDTYYGGSSDYAPFWKNRDGLVVKRVLPAHEPGDSPYVPMLTTMLKCEVDKKDKDGNVIGKEIANKKIFLATLHGKFPFDLTEEYIKRVYEKAESIQDKEDRSRFLNPVTGYRMGGKNGTWVPGIRPSLEYVFYAYIEGKIYRDSLKPKQMEALNKESADLCAQNDTAAVDMFSDPDVGFPIQWSRSKDDKNKTVETIKSLPLNMKQTWEDYFEKHAVPDKVLEELSKFPSLKELYVDCYRKRDFDFALEGLKRFDESNNYNIFADEEFLDLIEELQRLVEEKLGKEQKSDVKDLPFTEKEMKPILPTKKSPVAKKTTKKAKSEPTDEEKLAIVNAEFIRQYGEGYEELDLEGEELDETYNLAIQHEDLGYDIEHVPGWDTEGDEEEEEEDKPEVVSKPVAKSKKTTATSENTNSQPTESSQSAIDRIRQLRAQSGK